MVSNYKFNSFDGAKLDLTRYTADNSASNLLIITHGYGEHQGYYVEMAKYFNGQGFDILTYDLRSHGKSDGKKGDVKAFDYFISDLSEIVKSEFYNSQAQNIFLLGHSMGGNITLNYLLKNPKSKVKKAVITSPLLRLAFDPSSIKLILAKIAVKIVPGLVMPGELEIEELSNDSDFKIKFKNDPLTYDKISPRFYFTMKDAGLNALKNAEILNHKCLLVHALKDKITSAAASEEFASKVPQFCSLKILHDNHKHVIFSESDKQNFFREFLEYLVSV